MAQDPGTRPKEASEVDITESTARTQPTTEPPTTATTTTNPSKKRKKNHRTRHTKTKPRPHILHQFTLRQPKWTYIHLRHLSPHSQPQTRHQKAPETPDLDAITATHHLQTALSQFLGLHGAAVAFDILKLRAQDVWIRAPSEDHRAIVAAAGGWVSGKGEGWMVVEWSAWDAGVDGEGEGRGLFEEG